MEVALFFQKELSAAAKEGADPASNAMSVVLLSADNAQLSLAKAHGLPVRATTTRSSLTCRCLLR